jgi:hypothetical protein
MKPTISKPFKSNDRTFEKVFGLFNKKDYFNVKGLAKTQIGNFERALQKNDKNAQQVLDMFKGDERKAKEYILQVIHDRKKEQAFNDYKALKDAVDSIQSGKPNVGAVEYVKRIIHNNNQKYSIALYSTLTGKKLNNYKDIHKDIDSSIGEGFSSDAQRKAAFANGYEEKDKKNEGKKRFKRQDGIGKAKYTISYHDGKKKHKDGSDFFDIKIFKNKKDLSDFVGTLAKQGYKLTRESVNEGISVSDERHFGKKGIIIMIDDNGKKVSAIFKDKKNADKFNRNKSSDIQKLLQLAKKTKYPKAIDESLNEAGKLAMGIAALTGTRGSAVQDFIDKNRINDKKLFKALKKANLQGRINFASALAGRPGNPNEKLTIKLFGESKKEVIAFRKKAKSETAFYDILDKIERKYGRGVFEKWLDKSLKDLKLNPKKYKTSADKQEALYQAKL